VALEDDGDGGVAITAVVPSSPAARAQLRSGDRLLSIGGTQVDSYDALVEVLKSHRPDDDVAVVLEREITVHLDDAHKDGERYVLGVYLAEAKDKSSKKPGGDEQRGALVTRLNETYPAGRAGIEGGDRLLSIDGQPVDDSDSVIAALAGVHEERDVSVRIERTRQVKLGARPDAAPSRLGTPSPLAAPSPFGTPRATTPSTPTPTAPSQPRARTVRPATPPAPQAPPDGLEEELRALSQELRELREQVSRLRSQIDRLKER
jgi:S1-C subfamily serine protease